MSGNQPFDPSGWRSPSAEDANPYRPPSAATIVPERYRPPFRGMSFGHRLLLVPFWFLPAAILTMILFRMDNTHTAQNPWIGALGLLITIAPGLLCVILVYRWLMRPFRLERRALCLWAFMGVPLLAVAFLTSLVILLMIYSELSGVPLI